VNLAQRLWIYQRERFPLLTHGFLVAALTLGAGGFASAQGAWPPLGMMLGAFCVAFGCFALLRIADEFKDAADDATYRPYRPVPRGLVTLRQLTVAGIIVALLQLAITFILGWQLLPYLLAFWILLLLMSYEFFVAEWLRARPILYMFSHMLILPLIFLYLLAAAWQHVTSPPVGLGWFLLASYANGIVFEVGRKLRAPQDEEVGVETYSALWGVPRATALWLLAIAVAGVSGIIAGWAAGIGSAMSLVVVIGLTAVVWVGWRMVQDPTPSNSRWIEYGSALWVLALYLCLGVLPHLG
jgi:4-hydroxybenzoate polyprenyltransferase